MIRFVSITSDILRKADEKSADLGILSNSITSGCGNLAGFIGELMVQSILPSTVVNTYDYDLVIGGATADVKTKRTSVTPIPDYECSVAAYNTRQSADIYIFCRVSYDYSNGWVLGFLPKHEYYAKAKYLKQGDVDPSNHFVVKADCYNVAISELYDIGDISFYT